MRENGESKYSCPLGGEWSQEMQEKVTETHVMMGQLLEHTQHLTKLDNIAVAIGDMKNGLMSSATGRDQIPTKTVHMLFKMQGWIMLGLVAVIVYLLTGNHFGWVGALHN